MTPARAAALTKAVLVPLVTAGVVAWSEHRAAQNKARQDAAYAVTAPVLQELQREQAQLAARVDLLTKLVSSHVTQHPSAGFSYDSPSSHRPRAGAGQDQIKMAEKLRAAPALPAAQRPIPSSPDAALMELKR